MSQQKSPFFFFFIITSDEKPSGTVWLLLRSSRYRRVLIRLLDLLTRLKHKVQTVTSGITCSYAIKRRYPAVPRSVVTAGGVKKFDPRAP